MHRSRPTLALLGALLLGACAEQSPTALLQPDADIAASAAATNMAIAAARAGTARFQRVEEALAAGYVNTQHCVSSPDGGMGIHFVNMGLMMDAEIDPARPEALLYAPTKNGRMELIGVEYIVPRIFWEGKEGVPTLAGHPFEKNFHDHDHAGTADEGPPQMYALHAWIWKHNPSGMFAPFNPKVACE